MRMNHHLVPDFGVEDEFCTPTSSRFSRPAKSPMADEEIMELLWQNGQLVMQSQNQRNQNKLSPPQPIAVVSDAEQSTSREIISSSTAAPQPDDVSATNLFIQEDEMASWLHYHLEDTSFDHDFCSDFLYSSVAPTATATTATVELRPPVMPISTKPPISPVKVSTNVDSSRLLNFGHFLRMNGRDEIGQSVSSKAVRESTIVDSSDTPVTGQDSRVSQPVKKTCVINGTSSAGREMAMSSAGSSGGSGCVSVSAEATQKTLLNEDRKRKVQKATNNTDCRSEDVEFEPADLKKQVHGSTPAKRSRAAEVHNLSERRRRDRINEKMKVLQELIPRCNKSDKASMLDEAIEYLKSLQLQVQMMSMGCSMVPMMPGMQQYMAAPLGMWMGMDTSMSRPMMSFPPVLARSAMPTPSAAAHMGPRFPIPGYHMQPVTPSDPSRIQAIHQANSMLNPLAGQNHNLQQLPNFTNPYLRYYGLQQMPLPIPKDQATAEQGTSTPSTN